MSSATVKTKVVLAFRDFCLAELAAEMRARLERGKNRNWFCSLGFAESYCLPPADRVCFLEDSRGEVIEHCFYRERMWVGIFKQVEILGPIGPRSDLQRQLQRHTRADMLSVRWMATQENPPECQFWKAALFQRTGEDLCIPLPKSSSEYLRSLGASTRKHLPYYVRRLRKEWGNEWTFEANSGMGIHKLAYEQLLELQCRRASKKGQRTLWTEALRKHRWKLVTSSGLLCGLRFRERLVGGTLSFVHEDEAYLVAIGHEPEFDRLNLGNVSLWLTIEHLIQSGCRRFHLMWGRSFYKEQFGGNSQPLYTMMLFASPYLAAVWHIADFLMVPKIWSLMMKLRAKISLHRPEGRFVSTEHQGREVIKGGN